MLGRHPRRIVAAIVLFTTAVPATAEAATGSALREGQRNGTALAETEIIGSLNASNQDTGGYVTRQSNVKTGARAGGAAIYGCRTPVGGTFGGTAPCLRASNLDFGYAFEFNSLGLVAGLISVGPNPAIPNPDARPFTTNATGVATGLNADQVDGKSAADFLGKTEKAVSATTADSAVTATTATSAQKADTATSATKAQDSERLGDTPAADFPSKIAFSDGFSPASLWKRIKRFGDADLQARCLTAGANGFGQLRIVSNISGAQGDIHYSNGGETGTNVNSGLLGVNVELSANVLSLANFNSPGSGSARVTGTAPDGTTLVATLAVVSPGDATCKVSGFAMTA